MSENNTQKMITDAIFKSAIEKILTEISDYIYVEEPYTKPEIDDMFDATSQEIDYYSSLINDGMISENRLWSAKKISEELAKCILESNEYTDGLLSNLSSKVLSSSNITPIISSSSTDEQVPSAKAVYDSYGIKTYTDLTQIGLTIGGETMNDIAASIPSNSMLMINNNNNKSDGSEYPTPYGSLIVIKKDITRVDFLYYPNTDTVKNGIGYLYTGSYHDNTKFSGWKKVCTTSVTDVPITSIVSEDSSVGFGERSVYSVKNGICHVSLWDVTFSEEGMGKLVKQNLPKTDHFVSVPIIAANNGELAGYAYIDDGLNLRIHVYKTGLTGYASFLYPVVES